MGMHAVYNCGYTVLGPLLRSPSVGEHELPRLWHIVGSYVRYFNTDVRTLVFGAAGSQAAA